MHEIQVIGESEYIHQLRERAENLRNLADTPGARFLGIGTPFVQDLKKRAACYDFVADTIESAPKTQL